MNEIMLYVKDFDKSVDFWTRVIEYKIIEEADLPEGYKMVSLKEEESDQVTLVLFDREFIAKYSKEVLDTFPSIMFVTKDIEALRQRLIDNGVTVGENSNMGKFKATNFSDFEGNYFAAKERKC